jgi:hypothetical protein
VLKKLTLLTGFPWVNIKSLIGMGTALEPKVRQSSCVRYGAQALPDSVALPKLSHALRNVAPLQVEALRWRERVRGVDPSLPASDADNEEGGLSFFYKRFVNVI